MRVVLFTLALLVAACGSSSQDELSNRGPDSSEDPSPGSGGGSAPNAACVADSECELAALSCCECPTIAVLSGDGFTESCEDVQCGDPQDCPATEARCDVDGSCVLACAPVACDLSCDQGFAQDESGCLVCACATEQSGGCQSDSDCVQTPADCCGCAQGGSDTAVLEGDLDGFTDGLGCPSDPACPGVNTCDATEAPRCVLGECRLADEGSNIGTLDTCGAADSPTCGPGEVCVLNAAGAEAASAVFLGVCQPE